MLRLTALCASFLGLALAVGGGAAFAQSTTPPPIDNLAQSQTAAPSTTLPAWLSQAGEHWVSYYPASYIDTKSPKMAFDKELGRDVIEYWTLMDPLNDVLAAHFPRDDHHITLQKKYLDCESEAIAIVSVAERTIDGFPATFRPDHQSDRTFENREYFSVAPGDPDEIIARSMCRLATSALQQPSTQPPADPSASPAEPAAQGGGGNHAHVLGAILGATGNAMLVGSGRQPTYEQSPGYSSSSHETGQTVYSPSECVGTIVAGVCHGAILPNQATHPVCHGEMLNGTCTGPMF